MNKLYTTIYCNEDLNYLLHQIKNHLILTMIKLKKFKRRARFIK